MRPTAGWPVLPSRSGLELVRALHEIDPTTRIVVLTGYGSIATARKKATIQYFSEELNRKATSRLYEKGKRQAKNLQLGEQCIPQQRAHLSCPDSEE